MYVSSCAVLNAHPALTGKCFVIHRFFYLSLFGDLVQAQQKHIQFIINCSLTRVTGLVASFLNKTNQHQLLFFHVSCNHGIAKLYSTLLKSTSKSISIVYCSTVHWWHSCTIILHCMCPLIIYDLWFCVIVNMCHHHENKHIYVCPMSVKWMEWFLCNLIYNWTEQ